MSDDFGTVNISRAERAREVEAMRQRYARHRETLQKLAADAPTERLATEYRRLLGEIDAAMLKVDELAPGGRTEAGMRPLVTPPAAAEAFTYDDAPRSGSGARVVLILFAALIALGVIAGLIWWASKDRSKKPAAVVETTTTAAPATVAPDTVAPLPEPPANVLAASPASQDYGTIRKGTRATRQFEVRNMSDDPVTISVARSTCRCLFYEYRGLIAPKAKETVTVTVDGARAKAGPLDETVKVTKKNDPGVATSFQVTAKIQ